MDVTEQVLDNFFRTIVRALSAEHADRGTCRIHNISGGGGGGGGEEMALCVYRVVLSTVICEEKFHLDYMLVPGSIALP